jgi:hypothetical protein
LYLIIKAKTKEIKMGEEKYRLEENSLVIPTGMALVPNEVMRQGTLNVGLDCKWPDNVPNDAVRVWTITDDPNAVVVAVLVKPPVALPTQGSLN